MSTSRGASDTRTGEEVALEVSPEDGHRPAPSSKAAQTLSGGRRWIPRVVRWASAGALVLGLLLLARGLPVNRLLPALDGIVRGAGAWGPVLFGVAYAVGALLLLPGSILTLAAGAIFGPLVGTVVVSLASTAAAALAFLVGRYVARGAVEAAARRRPVFGAIDRAVGDGGWKVVALLRLSPLVPFSVGNYLFGLTRVRFVPYVVASWLAMLPGTFLYVYLGHAGREAVGALGGAERARTGGEWALLALGLAATVLVTVLITRRARAALRERTEAEKMKETITEGADEVRPWRLGALAAGSLLVLAAGVLASCGTFDRFFGPPPVELTEAYEEDGQGAFDHAALEALLKRHVDERGLVDYRGLQADSAELERYLAQLASADLDALGRDERLALLLNAYNAFTLQLILDHAPVGSIKDIPAAKRWDAVRWRLGSGTYSLDQLEHEEIRPKFREPRVHFALVCAAVGCPPLRREAYVGARLEAQLEDQTRLVHTDPRWFEYQGGQGRLRLTELYSWFSGDFEQVAGSVLDYAARYSPALREDLAAGRKPEVEWIPYDWKLNAQAGRSPAEQGDQG